MEHITWTVDHVHLVNAMASLTPPLPPSLPTLTHPTPGERGGHAWRE
jgi:hypothetical protein